MKRLLIIAAAVAATVLASLLLSGSQVSAQTPTPTPTPIPAGNYRMVIDCDGYYAAATSLTLTLNGSDVVTIPLSLRCSPGGQARQNFSAPSNWNDLKLQYWCGLATPTLPPTPTPPPATPTTVPPDTLDIPVPPRVELENWYLLNCPSTGITHGPDDGDPGEPRIQLDLAPVGGIADAPDVDAAALGATDSGGSSGTTNAVIAVAAVGLIVLGTGGWYARRRWLS